MITLLRLALLLLAALAVPAQARRVAVVVANAAYAKVPALANPLNDTRAVAAAFGPGGLDFDQVEQLSNADGHTLRRILAKLRIIVGAGDTLVLYLSGHVMQDEWRRNHFLPVDADILSPADIETEGLEIGQITDLVGSLGLQLGLIVVDAHPFQPFKQSYRHNMRPPAISAKNTVLLIHRDDSLNCRSHSSAHSSRFARAFAKQLTQPSRGVLDMLYRLDKDLGEGDCGNRRLYREGSVSPSTSLTTPAKTEGERG